MAERAHFEASAVELIESRLATIRNLTFAEAAVLPETQAEKIRVDGVDAHITIFRQVSPYQLEGRVLVVVQFARPRLLGMMSEHIERGLVFSPNEPTRGATELELQNSGG